MTDGSGVLSYQALDQVVAAVQKAYPRMATVKKQSRSVNVQISSLEFGFDIIPAWAKKPRRLLDTRHGLEYLAPN